MSKHNPTHTNPAGRASVTTPLDSLRAECASIGPRLGHRRRRHVSRSLYAALLSSGVKPERAAELARAVAGVEPSEWLPAPEAFVQLRRWGVRRNRHFLYRLAKKFAGATEPSAVWLDARGNWDAPGQSKRPVAVLFVRGGSPPRFRVMPASSSVTNPASP